MGGFTFLSVPRIVVETGGLDRLGTLMAGLGAKRVAIVCDRGIVEGGLAARARSALTAAGLTARVLDGVQADPPVATVRATLAAARDFAADGVVGLGGGSSLDTAKLVALLLRSGQAVEELYGQDKAQGPRLPLIQVPTTAGTGSEVTWASVVTSERNEKQAIYAPQLLPDIALLDAGLTLGMPPRVTAATGLDAMVHAVEAYTSRTRKNPVSDALAVKALALLGGNLRRVVADGTDLPAREAMLEGAMLAGMAFVNASVAAVHALSYPLGARFHVPHGHSNALVMGPVFRFNLPAAAEAYAELAPCLLPGRRFASAQEAAEAFVAALEELAGSVGLETRMSQLGVTEADLPGMAEEVVGGLQRLLANNPRDMVREDVVAMYRAVL
ncbi:NAD-dependent 4-hydroxybutyrate dehydrogenase [Roseomonas mucosa]|uniref:iron-containing alcohol dehydrogenase n=1 Tax=Roseomonas TaxID=125216 RepID=UPI00096815FF|nr:MULTISPECIES: iron-containing alcohol dehydrogenase [Roseomonas]MDT8263975.1 iron-containing alcohol dehydrogenase [Roseomonas sp. DSM 102946]ATR21637.1 alcohol dehydrogenase [Roseomonas sp. FDAARGOS_362]USQ70240.1 iron-containing alcohol dehydrogenase [Roseomonas mucosa]UZO95956.1 NAD-dependent 4-hydroxybutyrate dehydrogenase [Roseomonas mucosa]GAV34269.1 alcohol dehydrogenase 2 [Roseomonas sp. TAS13]